MPKSIGDVLYWYHPVIFISLTIIGVLSSLLGGFLVGKTFLINNEARRLFAVLSIGSGTLITLVGGLIGLVAIYLAVAIAVYTGYWGRSFPSGHYDYVYGYGGDYMFMGFQILAFFLSMLLGTIGSFLLGFGVQKFQKRG